MRRTQNKNQRQEEKKSNLIIKIKKKDLRNPQNR
jgi:hypothetical protein